MERLATTTTAAGVRVEVWWKGERRPLPAEIDLAAFRIIQESVTNVIRDAGADSCRVSVDYREDELAIEVRDRGQGGGTGTDTGYGLPGMRERVALLHGDFTAGPREGGGFQVTARLPLAALDMVITDAADMEVVGEAADGAEAVRLTEELAPDVVVMDIRMPGMDGIEATRLISAGTPSTRIVVLTTFDEDDYVYGALHAGASGFLVKDMALDDILAAVRIVAAGDALIAPGVTRRLIKEFVGRPTPAPARRATRLGGITDREREVLTLVGRGLSNTEIADELRFSLATAKTYMTRLLAKLDARDRVQLVIIAYEAGLVAP